MNVGIMDRKHRASVVDSLQARVTDDRLAHFAKAMDYTPPPEVVHLEELRAAIAAEHSQRIHYAVTVRRGRVPDPGSAGVVEHYNQSVREAVEEAGAYYKFQNRPDDYEME